MRMARKPPMVSPSNDKKPPMLKPAIEILPPKASITTATASAAPLLMPNTSGPARGLRKAVCSKSPLVARAAR